MTATLAYPTIEGSHLRSSSSSLHPPTELSNNRRLSDSAICWGQERAAKESEGELIKLRKWAAEVMSARPQSIGEPPVEEFEEDPSPPMLRRESEGRDRQLRPKAQEKEYHSTLPRRRAIYDRSSSPDSHSPDGRWSKFLASGFHARPTSMIATTSSAEKMLPQESSGLLMVSPSRLSRTASVRRKSSRIESGDALENLGTGEGPSTLLYSSLNETPKSVSFKGPLPSLQASSEYSVTPSSSPLARKGPGHLQNLRLAYPLAHSVVLSPDQRTPRAKNIPGLSSPTWTSSTCGSEDDGVDLMTPVDENVPRRSGPTSISMTRGYTGDTPPINTLEDDVADRVGFGRGLDQLGSSADHQSMQSMTGVNLASRRGSLPAVKTGSESYKLFATEPLASSDDTHSPVPPPPTSAAPILTRSTLFQVGHINGITPPISREHVGHSASHSFSSVVSAGLEMGMGVSMAASALSSNLPTTSSSGINNIAEPRFARHSGPNPIDYQSFAVDLKMTESQLPMNSVPAPPHYSCDAISERAADEVTFAELDREDAELARRRTTGGMAASKRETGVVGKRRHVRSGTHDPRNTGNTGKGHQRLASSISTFPGLAEEHDAELTHGLTRLNMYHDGPPSSEVSISSISEAIASGGHGNTPLGTPLENHKAMLSPDIAARFDDNSYMSSREASASGGDRRSALGKDDGAKVSHPVAGGAINGGLMGMGGGGHFGPGVRAKIAEVLEALLVDVPLMNYQGETVQLVEYGCLNSRSAQLMQPIISAFATRQVNSDPTVAGGYFDQTPLAVNRGAKPSLLSFQVTHEDASTADFRPLTQLLDSHPESYLDPHWQSSHSPSLTNTIFSNFSARPFASRITPPQTFHAGISLMDLHWTHTPVNSHISSATTAQAELTTFLSARGHEFKRGGVLIMAYIARSEEVTPSGSKDIWTTLSNTLAPCIQRLVSCSMVKSEVARHLLNLPMHPRSAKQTKAVLKNVEHTWKVEWSCGLGEGEMENASQLPPSEPLPLRLPHPAWKAYDSGTLSRIPFTEHMIQLFKNLYESHFRSVLREKGKLSKGAVEFVLDSLWDVLFSRIVDQHPSPMKDVEIEVSIVALRRQ